MTEKKPSKRKMAIENIRIEFAKHGKATRESTRAYIENRISSDTYYAAAKAGLRQFRSNEV
jgi:hypothetical protein